MIFRKKTILLLGILIWPVFACASDVSGIQVEAGLTRDYLNKGYADWRSSYVEAENKLGERQVVYGMLRETDRFAQKDAELLAGYYHPLGKQWTGLLEGNISSTHIILPRLSALAQLQYAWDEGWGAYVGLRHTEYDSASTNLGIFTLERYWGNYRAAYALYSGYLANAGSTISQRMQFSRYYSDHSWLGIALSGGQELENLGSRGVLQTNVQSLIFNGRHWLSNEWAVSYEVSVTQQGDFYTRNGASLGLRRQF